MASFGDDDQIRGYDAFTGFATDANGSLYTYVQTKPEQRYQKDALGSGTRPLPPRFNFDPLKKRRKEAIRIRHENAASRKHGVGLY